ncbi:MAG TPA: hypothetical protein VKM94_04505 [Blastocatellia bacterium]|nr:hypothetical protein [Blastocatellia bacterium]
MQRTARNNLAFTGISSFKDFTDSRSGVVGKAELHLDLLRQLARAATSHNTVNQVGNIVIQVAERAYNERDLTRLRESTRILESLPTAATQDAGLYYRGLALTRERQIAEARPLLESVADCTHSVFRARALQTLGVISHLNGDLDGAAKLQIEALRAANSRERLDLQTPLMAQLNICAIRSIHGDHAGAMRGLESLAPVVQSISKTFPFYFYLYQNALAVELAELGRFEEALRASSVAISSPFAVAYPEWRETREEIEEKRTNPSRDAATAVRPNTAPCADRQVQRKALNSAQPLTTALPGGHRSTAVCLSATRPIASHRTRAWAALLSVPEYLGECSQPRAPPIPLQGS